MLISDILHSCSNERVAEAAVESIGGEFAARVRILSARSELATGALVGNLVRRFARDARQSDWQSVASAIAGQDLPILAGLRSIVEAMISTPEPLFPSAASRPDASATVPIWSIFPSARIESPEAPSNFAVSTCLRPS